jgi:Ca-activated chloride channel family protein
MWRFESSSHLFWLLAAPAVLAIFFYYYRRWQSVARHSFGERVVPYLIQNFSARKAFFKALCMALAIVFFVIAWARPQMGKGQSEIKSEGVEIMVLVDVSNSMLAEDVRPSRLEHAKKEVMRLFDMMSGDKVGLIAFAESAVLLSPLTPDKSALKMFVEGLSPQSVENQGTNIGKALQEAKDAFLRGGVESDEHARVTKVVLVISDGEDHEPGTEKIAKDLVDNGIRVFTMAFGTEAGGKIPVRDSRGVLRDYLKDKNGQVITTQVKGDFLRSLAVAGSGSFYHVTFGGDQMNSLKEDLDHLEKAEFDSMVATSYQENYQWFLAVGLVFALIELFLGNRKKVSGVWKGRFPV